MGKKRQNRSSRGSGSGSGKSSSSSFSGSNKQSSSSTSSTKSKSSSSTETSNPSSFTATAALSKQKNIGKRFIDWCYAERDGLRWVLGCAFIGALLGFGIGTGYLTGAAPSSSVASTGSTSTSGTETTTVTTTSSPWRVALGMKIRSTTVYQMSTFQIAPWEPFLGSSDTAGTSLWSLFWDTTGGSGGSSSTSTGTTTSSSSSSGMWNRIAESYSKGSQNWMTNPSHPYVFDVLKEAIIREPGGYVHPDLGILSPAPCGAARGLGMVSFQYTTCQSQCSPGISKEKKKVKKEQEQQKIKNNNNNEKTKNENDWGLANTPTVSDKNNNSTYKQEEVLLRIPLSIQMTRQVALDTLVPLIPMEVQRRVPLEDLDDATLLVLLLSHERGLGKASRFWPYILSLPVEPSCGYSFSMRQYMLDSINMMGEQLGLDVNGWPAELAKATQYAERIAGGLARDYGSYLQTPDTIMPYQNFQWSLCQVASRGTAGSDEYGSLRMVPIMDMINHDANAGGFVELMGTESYDKGDFVEAAMDEAGTFVVRSIRHGKRKPLKKGQELLVNYNVPGYSPLDWFVSLGFVPPERWSQWTKIDAALPRVRTTPQQKTGSGTGEHDGTSFFSTSSSSAGNPSTSNNNNVPMDQHHIQIEL